jgi:predicted dehydrogenase
MGSVAMRFLVIGLGSMGKRRIRNLIALGFHSIFGFDLRQDRREETARKFGIAVFEDVHHALDECNPDALVISTSPEHHMQYAWLAFENSLHAFIEASVVEKEQIKRLAERLEERPDLVIVPSCTMRFFPGPSKIRELLAQNSIGKPLFFNYHTGQYLPDWHPWEPISDFYVSKRETGGAREIVPFELAWLNELFGRPEPRFCRKRKLTNIDADIDDYYQFSLSYHNGIEASVTIEVISRPFATRELKITGSEGTLTFSSDSNTIRLSSIHQEDWKSFSLEGGTVEAQYINPEEPYIEEIRSFVKAIEKKERAVFPNDLFKDTELLDILDRLEALSERG